MNSNFEFTYLFVKQQIQNLNSFGFGLICQLWFQFMIYTVFTQHKTADFMELPNYFESIFAEL